MRLIAIWLAVMSVAASTASPIDVASFAVAVHHLPMVDAADLIALATIETGATFRSDLTSSAGACGVMQVMPAYSPFTCAGMREPLHGVVAGAISWVYWRRRKGSLAAMHYNAGNHPKATPAMARRSGSYQRRHDAIARRLKPE